MEWLDLQAINPVGNGAIFAVAAIVVWLSGNRSAHYSRVIAERTKLGQAFIGTVLLGVTVSLPETALAGVAAALGNAELAVNSLLGGIGITMVMVALTDFAVWRGAALARRSASGSSAARTFGDRDADGNCGGYHCG